MASMLYARRFRRWNAGYLALLLTDQSGKLIAANLGVTPSTVHTYVRGVLRKLGVRGRSGLISLWLGRQG